MATLWTITLLWAFSFSLIGEYLSGEVDSWFAVTSRAALAILVFLPWLLRTAIRPALAARLMAIGAIQLGVMYVCFFSAFAYLSVAEVALFTVLTPLWITLLEDLLRQRFSPRYLLAAALAVMAGAMMRLQSLDEQWLTGFLLVQAANLCFALGQVSWRRLIHNKVLGATPQHAVFAWFFVGALLVSLLGSLIWGDYQQRPSTPVQWGILLWLGVVASGLGYFFWNRAATMVSAGTLAVMNSALVPAAIAVNLMVWQKPAPLMPLLGGSGLLLLALWVGKKANSIPLSRA